MKVIMLKDVRGVGRRGQAVDVADGYALNHLIPRGLAEQATAAKLAAHDATQKRDAAAHDARERELAEIAKKIDGATVDVNARANPQGTLFKQISAEMVTEAIRKTLDADIPPDAVLFNAPIKQIGECTARITLGGSTATITIRVVQVH